MEASENWRPYKPPKNPKQQIWRYMDLAKFAALLNRQALYLCRADNSGDPFEGSYSEATLKQRAAEIGKNPAHDVEAYMTAQRKTFKEQRLRTFLNCWHMNNCESAAMWNLYSRGSQGIAITTTYDELRSCLRRFDSFLEFGQVEYLDYLTDPRPMADLNGYFPYFYKRLSFAYEHEFRIVLWDGLGTFMEQSNLGHTEDGLGIELPLDLNRLVRQIFVAPGSPGWYVDTVAALASKYGLSATVANSAIDADPLY